MCMHVCKLYEQQYSISRMEEKNNCVLVKVGQEELGLTLRSVVYVKNYADLT